ncbi:MAG: hypothetical protein ABSE48_13845 [Verrucomicrobiota bacterium]|jgi:hypothetical protein
MNAPKYKTHRNIIASNRNRYLRIHEVKLTAMRESLKSFSEMTRWLRQQDEECSVARLKEFFRHRQHLNKMENQWYEMNASKERSGALQEFLANNPPPDLATVTTLLRFLIFQLATGGKITNESIKLMDRLARTVMTHELALKQLEMDSGEPKQTACEVPDFDNTEKIAAMRKAAFQEAEDLLASGRLVIPE